MNTYKISKLRIFAVLLAVLLLFSFASCEEEEQPIPTLASDGEGGLKNEQTNVSYRGAPSCYEAWNYLSDTPIAQEDGVNYYALDGAKPEEWLWCPDYGMLLYARSLTLPTLEELDPNGVRICVTEEDKTRIAFDETDAKKVDAILDAYQNGETATYMGGMGKTIRYSFSLKFYSENYPFLQYNLLFLQYSDDHIEYALDENGETVTLNYGKNFIYNRSEDRFVPIDESIMQEYIDEYYHNSDAEEDTDSGAEAI